MEQGGHRPPKTGRGGRRRLCAILSAAAVLLVIVVVALVFAVGQDADDLEATFIGRCMEFKGYDCQKLWDAFQLAYVGLDPCKVPAEAYDPLIAAAPLRPACNRVMLWCKTRDLVLDFTKKRGCFMTLEDTVLGSTLDGLIWCGKEGSSETFTTGCPGWTDCLENAVRSFWVRASAAFADAACGDVSAMLNGSIDDPFAPESILANIEVKRLNSSRVKSLNVVLVTQNNTVNNCTDSSLKDLQKELDEGIQYNCKEVAESRIQECSSNPEIPCGACW